MHWKSGRGKLGFHMARLAHPTCVGCEFDSRMPLIFFRRLATLFFLVACAPVIILESDRSSSCSLSPWWCDSGLQSSSHPKSNTRLKPRGDDQVMQEFFFFGWGGVGGGREGIVSTSAIGSLAAFNDKYKPSRMKACKWWAFDGITICTWGH